MPDRNARAVARLSLEICDLVFGSAVSEPFTASLRRRSFRSLDIARDRIRHHTSWFFRTSAAAATDRPIRQTVFGISSPPQHGRTVLKAPRARHVYLCAWSPREARRLSSDKNGVTKDSSERRSGYAASSAEGCTTCPNTGGTQRRLRGRFLPSALTIVASAANSAVREGLAFDPSSSAGSMLHYYSRASCRSSRPSRSSSRDADGVYYRSHAWALARGPGARYI